VCRTSSVSHEFFSCTVFFLSSTSLSHSSLFLGPSQSFVHRANELAAAELVRVPRPPPPYTPAEFAARRGRRLPAPRPSSPRMPPRTPGPFSPRAAAAAATSLHPFSNRSKRLRTKLPLVELDRSVSWKCTVSFPIGQFFLWPLHCSRSHADAELQSICMVWCVQLSVTSATTESDRSAAHSRCKFCQCQLTHERAYLAPSTTPSPSRFRFLNKSID
jgi:hypothetical protein